MIPFRNITQFKNIIGCVNVRERYGDNALILCNYNHNDFLYGSKKSCIIYT